MIILLQVNLGVSYSSFITADAIIKIPRQGVNKRNVGTETVLTQQLYFLLHWNTSLERFPEDVPQLDSLENQLHCHNKSF